MVNAQTSTILRPGVRYLFRWWAVAVLLMAGLGNAPAQTTAPVQLKNDLVTVVAPAGRDTYAKTVMGHATAALRTVNNRTGDALLVPIQFTVAQTEADFKQQVGNTGENTLAVALGSRREIVINYEAMARSASDKIQQVLVHELAHVYLDVRCTGPVPHWVHEGVAQMMAGEWPDSPGSGHLALSAYTGGLIPLRELVSGFPIDISRRNMAYAESLSAVQFLVQQDYGGSLKQFLAAIRGEQGEARLKELAGGVALDAFTLRWKTDLRSPVYLLGVLVSSGFFWGVTALLVVAAWVVVRRRSRLIRKQWAYEEAMAGEFESIIDRVERFDEELASAHGDDAPLYDDDEHYLEETPYDRYLAEKEESDPDDLRWR